MTLKKLFPCLAFVLCFVLSGCAKADTPAADPILFAELPEQGIAEDITELKIKLHPGETELLDRLTKLESADFSGSECLDEIYVWAESNPQVDVCYTVSLPDGTVLDTDAKKADLSKMAGNEICAAADILRYLPNLSSIELGEERSNLSWEDIGYLQQTCPKAKCKFMFTLYGKTFDLQNTQINLSHIPVNDGGAAVKEVMAYMPRLTYVDMDTCGVSNEDMASIRDSYPDIKVVWRIWFGDKMLYSVRTDVERILASKSSVGGFVTQISGADLKYCTEVKYLDLGHNPPLTDISFVEYMPELEVAILAMDGWSDASPLASCPKLEYLEMQTTECTDLSPLAGLENLRHLNVAGIPSLRDISPLYKLTGLERLYIGSNNMVPWEQVEEMQKAAPNCEINTSVYDDPTGEKWRYNGQGTWNYRYYVLRKQFGEYKDSAFSFHWNDPLY